LGAAPITVVAASAAPKMRGPHRRMSRDLAAAMDST